MATSSKLTLALACAQLAQALTVPAKRQSSSTLTPYTLDGWQSLGCWSDSQSSRTLSVAAHFGEHVDDDNCQYQCTQLGYVYAGTEYSGQCYCANQVNSVATQQPDTDCYMPCNGDQNQPCGGPDRINLFWNGKTAAATPTASTNAGVDNWVFEGCYTDDIGSRTLAHQVNTNDGGAMTIKTCVDACSAAGYSLAGAEYAGQCYCDDTYTNGALASDQTTCNMACKGNASEYCGGAGRMNLYSYNGATPVEVQAAPAATSSAASPPVNIPSGWTTLGCYTDSDNPAKRALGAFFNQPSGGMTVETCINLCSTNGYTIAGVEYSTECYCDTEIRNNQGLASDGNAGCNMECSGNSAETCGGPNRLNVYAAGGEWVQLGCYTDQPYSRTLAYSASYAGQLTPDTCMSACKAAGYPYAGTEYGDECHCGSSFDNGGGVAPDGNAGCSFACAGNSSEICGGSQRLSLYEYINVDGTVSSTTPGSSTTSPTTSPTTAATSQPDTQDLPSGWSHRACYVDQTNGRILPQQQPESSSLTPVSCINTCSAAGYSVAGVEYASQCFCGNAIVNGGAPASQSVSDSQCHMSCSGDATQSCGGPGLMDIYYTGTLTSQAPAIAQTSGLPSTWQYAGCLSDSIGARTLPVQMNVDNNDAATCLTACAAQNYAVGGLEYGSQCFCGAESDIDASGATTSSQCTMSCAGDSSYLCGGPGAMNYYTLGSAPADKGGVTD